MRIGSRIAAAPEKHRNSVRTTEVGSGQTRQWSLFSAFFDFLMKNQERIVFNALLGKL